MNKLGEECLIVVEVDTTHGLNTILMSKTEEGPHPYEYSESDNISESESYRKYLVECAALLTRAREQYEGNHRVKHSIAHVSVLGYTPSEELTSQVVEERQGYVKKYLETVNPSGCNDENSMFKNFEGAKKRIRVLRELSTQGRNITLTRNISCEKQLWFTRYHSLSKFVQAARTIILRCRLEKNLTILKKLTPFQVMEIERQLALERGEPWPEEEEPPQEVEIIINPFCHPSSEVDIKPCWNASKNR